MGERTAAFVTEVRPWGRWTAIDEGEGYKVKRLEVWPGHRLSLQVHAFRSEHWVVAQGVARVTRGPESFLLKAREATFIPEGTPHRLANPLVEGLLVVIEVQTGTYLEEDDIVRLEDDYGRRNRLDGPSGKDAA